MSENCMYDGSMVLIKAVIFCDTRAASKTWLIKIDFVHIAAGTCLSESPKIVYESVCNQKNKSCMLWVSSVIMIGSRLCNNFGYNR